MVLIVCCTVAAFLAGLWYLLIAIWGGSAKNREKTIATLVEARHYKNLHSKYGVIPNWCDCVYVYQVGEKTYKLRIGKKEKKSRLFKKVEVIYVKGFPKRAAIGQYRSDEAWVLAGGFLLLAAIFLWVLLNT